MNLTVAGLIATAISYVLFITLAMQLVRPWLNRQPLTVALSALLWVHAFRHVALQIFSAQRFGFALSDLAAASNDVWAVGSSGSSYRSLVMHWNGTAELRHPPKSGQHTESPFRSEGTRAQ